MIPLRFYRDDKNVYYNNPDGTTKSMTIQEFEEHFSGGSGELPEYDSGNAGEVLSVDSDGDLDWVSLQPSGGSFHIEMDSNFTLSKKWSEINAAIRSGSLCIVDFDSGDTDIESFNYSNYIILDVGRGIDAQFNPTYYVSMVAAEASSIAVYKFTTTTADGYPVYAS